MKKKLQKLGIFLDATQKRSRIEAAFDRNAAALRQSVLGLTEHRLAVDRLVASCRAKLVKTGMTYIEAHDTVCGLRRKAF